jgi:hypothetical protein
VIARIITLRPRHRGGVREYGPRVNKSGGNNVALLVAAGAPSPAGRANATTRPLPAGRQSPEQ